MGLWRKFGLYMVETHLEKARQTVKLGLIVVMKALFPGEDLKTAYSILEGVFCRLNKSVMSVREVEQVRKAMEEWAESAPLIEDLGQEGGYYLYRCGEILVKMIYPCLPCVDEMETYRIFPYGHGFIVDFGEEYKGTVYPPDKLSGTYHKTQKWLQKLNLERIEDINQYIRRGEHNQLISLAEALHEKEISEIANAIVLEKRNLRVLLISGPSSAGKTSFAQRLSTQLRVNGLKPVPISLDNYFHDEGNKPIGEDGTADWECLQALDLVHLQTQVEALIRGETVEAPIYSFHESKRKEITNTLTLHEDEILIIEGIHALNPALLPNINRSSLFKVYITSLFELNIDLANRIPGSEIRLLRRLVRGDRYRGTDPEETLNQWAAVRQGEYQNIFKFQEECDAMFNSSLFYEMNVLRTYGEASLNKIREDSPYRETRDRLLNLLSFCEPMDGSKIPFNSLIREFIGESIYFGR